MTRHGAAAFLLVALLTGGTAAVAHAGPALQDDNVLPIVRAKRAVVLDPQAEVISISAAATILLQYGDIATLREVLAGEASRPSLGVLAALGQAEPESCEALMVDVVALAARTTDDELRRAAYSALDNQLEGAPGGKLAPPRVRTMLTWLTDGQLPVARRVVVVRAVGRSGDLSYVEPLVAALKGDLADEVRAALKALTGHDLGPAANGEVWRAWWASHNRYTREQLLELALQERERTLDTQRSSFDGERAQLIAKAVAARIERMGEALDALLAGLADEYPEVRLEAARRLAGKGNDERATAAVPALLRRLGHAPAAGSTPHGGTGPYEASPAAEGVEGVEGDVRVRAALVTALGVLGRAREEGRPPEARARDDVLAALSTELRSSDPAVCAAAAAALQQFHDQPAVVRPLLDYLASLPNDSSPAVVDAKVKALQAIAANAPSQVVRDLLPFAEDSQPDSVRAAAVRAIMACEDIVAALQSVGEIYRHDESTDVRFNIAAALGDRLGRLGPQGDDDARSGMVALLGNLLEDGEVSVRLEAASALGRAHTDTAFTLIDRRARKETDPKVQLRLVNALGGLQKPQGAAVIGAMLGRTAAADRPALMAEAQKALALIAADHSPALWLECAEALHAGGAHDAAAFCCREVSRRFGDQPDGRQAVDQARGRLAVELLHDGQAREARELLTKLDIEEAPFPPHDERLLLLADASRLLEDWSAEADWRVRHLFELPAGDARHAPETLAAARALRRAGRNAEAVPLLQEHLQSHAEDNEALLDLAAAEESLGQLEAALHDLERLLGRLAEGDALRPQVQSAHERVRGLVSQPAKPPETPGGRQQQSEAVGAPHIPDSGAVGDPGTD